VVLIGRAFNRVPIATSFLPLSLEATVAVKKPPFLDPQTTYYAQQFITVLGKCAE
jgi:hypothetical protein